MFKKNTDVQNNLDSAIDELISALKTEEAGTERYSEMSKSVEVLMKARSHKKAHLINADTAMTVGGNLLGILTILHFEKLNVVTSKAVGFVMKAKL